MSPTDPTGRKKPEMTPSAENRASSAPLRMRTLSPDSTSIACASFSPFEARRMASVATVSIRATPMASAMARNRRTASTARRKWSGRDRAALGQPFGEPGERFFVEARHRRPAEPVIDQEPDRVRADVDDRIGRPVGAPGALRVELKRTQRLSRGLIRCLGHRGFSRSRVYHEAAAMACLPREA